MPGHLEVAKRAALAAGKILLRHYGKPLKQIKKSANQYVTKADHDSNKIITQLIKKQFPEHNIVSEEADYIDMGGEYTWYIDPLDGTHNYMRGIPIFGISIALLHRREIIAGVIYLPIYNKLYYSEKGKGSFMNGKRIKVSAVKPPEVYTVAVETGIHIREAALKLMEAMKHERNRMRAFACAVFSLVQIAEGNVEAFIPLGTNLYDVGAGIVIVQESGGKTTNIHGKPWDTKTRNYLFTNGKLHRKMLGFIKKAKI